MDDTNLEAIRHERRAVDAFGERLTMLERGLPAMMGAAVETAIRAVMRDPDVRKEFWRTGYEELAAHAETGASKWVGKRIVTTLIMALVTAGIVWLVKSGAIK